MFGVANKAEMTTESLQLVLVEDPDTEFVDDAHEEHSDDPDAEAFRMTLPTQHTILLDDSQLTMLVELDSTKLVVPTSISSVLMDAAAARWSGKNHTSRRMRS